MGRLNGLGRANNEGNEDINGLGGVDQVCYFS